MGKDSEIAWTDHTFNGWIGCSKVSPGCDHCYADRDWGMAPSSRHKRAEWGPHGERSITKTWQNPLKWDREPNPDGRRWRVFTNALGDVFDNKVPNEWRHRLWDLIAATPNLEWLVLSKRPQNMQRMLPTDRAFLANIRLGISAENDTELRRRAPYLAAVNHINAPFISAEPLLGPLPALEWAILTAGIRWVIVGGESGDMARPMDLTWCHEIRDTCHDLGAAFFMKQLSQADAGVHFRSERHIPHNLMVREFPL